MYTGRLISVATLGLLAAGIIWLTGGFPRNPAGVTHLQIDTSYAVAVTQGDAQFDLDFSSGRRYLLIASSLGPSESSFSVRMQSEAIATIEPLPVSPVSRLPIRHIGSGLVSTGRKPGGGPLPQAARSRDFSIHVTDGDLDDRRGYVNVTGRLCAEGRYVRVYLDSKTSPSHVRPALLREIVDRFDNEVIPVSQRTLGMHRDVDGDGKFAVLLTPWLARLQGGRTSVGGFVRSSDFRPDVQAPFSNHSDILYLNATIPPGTHLRSLLAHEYAHAVLFSHRLTPASPLQTTSPEEDWLNEAIAHLAENLHGPHWSNLDYRISRFLNDPGSCPLVVADYYRSGRWRDHGCRGATYLFLRWCVDQFGEGLLRELIDGPSAGTRNLELATGVPFPELFRHWTIALSQSDRTTPSSESVAPPEPFRFLNLRGPLARNWGLAGPRSESCDLSRGSVDWELLGTTCQFVELTDSQCGRRRIRVAARPECQMQLTLIPLQHDWPQLRIAANWTDESGAASARSAATSHVQLDILPGTTAGLTVELIACEANSGNFRESVCVSGEDLAPFRAVLQETGHVRLPVQSQMRRRGSSDWLVKVLAHDAQGRRTSAWARIHQTPVRLTAWRPQPRRIR